MFLICVAKSIQNNAKPACEANGSLLYKPRKTLYGCLILEQKTLYKLKDIYACDI